MKVRTLKEEVSSLKLFITELEGVSFIYLHIYTINIFGNLCLIYATRAICVHLNLSTGLVALHIFSPSQQNYDP